MEFQVNTNNVILSKINQVESGEYNVTECRFNFSSEYDGLTKIAVFTGANGDTYKITILNNKCEIPSELLTESQIVQIGVYAYEVQGTEFVLRYSPMPTRFMIEKGSYVVNAVNMSRPTPTEVEQLQSQITHNANNIEGIQGDIAGINQELVGINGELLGINRDIDDIKAEQTEQNTKIQKNTDDIVEINQNINEIDSHINAINEDIDNLEQDLTNYSLITETGSQINLNVNSTNYQITATLKDKNGNVIYTSNAIDLPIESMIVNASYDNTTKEIVLTLQNGNTLRISVADLVSGLVSETQLQTILANYYTKTEVDNLLSEKANQTSLDTTNQNVTNLAGRVSTNETDIADIKQEQTTQNTNIEELQNQVETLQEDLESANSEIEELNTDITNMAKAMLQVEGQGTDISLENTSENKFVELGLEGNTEQEQLTGKNLVNVADRTINASGYDQYLINNYDIDNSKNYTISFDYEFVNTSFSSTGAIIMLKKDSNYTSLVASTASTTGHITASISGTSKLGLYVTNRFESGTIKIKNVMLEEGSTATSYEPYCGGIPSPNPDFPQQIKNVTGNANVKIQNKNLFDGKLELGIYSGSTGAKSPSNSYIRSVNYIEVDELSDYKFSLSNGNGISLYIYEYKKDFSYNQSASKLVNSSSHLVTNKDTKYITFRTYSENTDINEKIQLEKGKSITSYVEGKEQNYPFTFAEGQRGMQGTTLEDDGIHNKRTRFVLDGTEDWRVYGTSNNINQIIYAVPANKTPKYAITSAKATDLKCSHFTSVNYSKYWTIENSILFALERTISIQTEMSLNEFKAFLETQYNNNTPLTIEYELKEEEKIPYNETQQAQYNNIKANASSYDDITYITSESDEVGFNMNVVAVANANKVIDKELQEIKSAVIALGGDINV